MSITRWASRSIQRTRTDGLDGFKSSTRPVYNKALEQLNILYSDGKNIYEESWNLLVVLDACRLDLMREVADEYDYLSCLSPVRSLDSTTAMWMEKTFVDRYSKEMRQTEYICGNPFSSTKLSAADFAHLDPVWKNEWLDIGTVPPRAITDRVIEASRNRNPDRIIAHYMQPHCPFVRHPDLMSAKDLDRWGDQDSKDVWEKLRDKELTQEQVWEGYRDNLRLALTEVELLLDNIDAERVIITSDHGNAKGEWMVYGHPPGSPLRCLREVPWVETSATDRRTHVTDICQDEGVSIGAQEQLRALGYTQ